MGWAADPERWRIGAADPVRPAHPAHPAHPAPRGLRFGGQGSYAVDECSTLARDPSAPRSIFERCGDWPGASVYVGWRGPRALPPNGARRVLSCRWIHAAPRRRPAFDRRHARTHAASHRRMAAWLPKVTNVPPGPTRLCRYSRSAGSVGTRRLYRGCTNGGAERRRRLRRLRRTSVSLPEKAQEITGIANRRKYRRSNFKMLMSGERLRADRLYPHHKLLR